MWLLAILALAVYMLPWFIAAFRDHPQHAAIGALTMLLGWTFIGWAIAMVWSLTKIEKTE